MKDDPKLKELEDKAKKLMDEIERLRERGGEIVNKLAELSYEIEKVRDKRRSD